MLLHFEKETKKQSYFTGLADNDDVGHLSRDSKL